MVRNFIVILLFIALLAVMRFFFNVLMNKGLFPYTEKVSLMVANKLKWEYWVLLLEILFIVVSLCSLIITIIKTEVSQNILFFIYFIFILFISQLIYELRKNPLGYVSIFDRISKMNFDNYFFSRVKLFFEHCLDMSLICILVITYTFIIELKWPTYVYFLGFLVLPIYTNIWIYFTRKGRLRVTEIISIRRAFVYFLIAVYAIYQAYILFINEFLEKTLTLTDEDNLILYIAVFVFIAIERLLKAFTDDYTSYKNGK